MWCWSPTTGTTWGEPMIRHRHIDRICCRGHAAGPGAHRSALFRGGPGDPARQRRTRVRLPACLTTAVSTPWTFRWRTGQLYRERAQEEYIPCTAVIDGEAFYQVGLRAKGNNSLRLTEEYGLSRYSLKLEFDHYVDGGNYYGLDKFSLDASFQDNSYLKTYLVYDMMAYMGVPAPLCSYAWVTVNGQPWGLFLAIEEPEEAFARRNFGPDHGAALQAGLPLPERGKRRRGPAVYRRRPSQLPQHL